MNTTKCLKKIFTTMLLVATFSSAPSYAQLILNGSFEIGPDPESDPVEHALLLSARDTKTLPAWTVSNGSIDYIGSRWPAKKGERCLDLAGIEPATITQNISGLTPGVAYRLSFWMAPSPEGGRSNQSVKVDLGTFTRIFSVDKTAASTLEHLEWAERIFIFKAQSTNMVLKLTSLEADVFGPALDAVSIAPIQDLDEDGVLNSADRCQNTPPTQTVESRGCSLEQLAPCSQTPLGNDWENHDSYVQAVTTAANVFYSQGLFDSNELYSAIEAALASNCGN